MRLALYQPDQAGNVGTILRLAACLDVPLDVIEPCGFPWGDRALRRAGMDYAELANVTRHEDWAAFEARRTGRLVLLTTSGDVPLDAAQFAPDDVLLLGSESHGVPAEVHARAPLRVRIRQAPATRSLNVAVAAGIVLGEALRQTGLWPGETGMADRVSEFQLSKYERDREHELELNKFTHALEVERLKVLQLLNGGAVTVFLGFSTLLLHNDGAPRRLGIAAAAAWVAGLVVAAGATQVQLWAQSHFSRAYRLRRTAVEWRGLVMPDNERAGVHGPLRYDKGKPVFATSAEEFEAEATKARGEGESWSHWARWMAWASAALFAAGAILMTVSFAGAKAPPPAQAESAQPTP
jgi:tRNA (cytidine/uridine-2'-O-)-methyltransferase